MMPEGANISSTLAVWTLSALDVRAPARAISRYQRKTTPKTPIVSKSLRGGTALLAKHLTLWPGEAVAGGIL